MPAMIRKTMKKSFIMPSAHQRPHNPARKTVTRRKFLAGGSAGLLLTACSNSGTEDKMNDTKDPADFSFGLVTDLHYAEKDTWNSRVYRDSDDKLRECIAVFNSLKPSFVVELGDIVDKADIETELGYLETINSIFREFNGERHYIIGNHDVATFSKSEFLTACGAEKSYYSFDRNGCHFIALDANYNRDGSDYNAGNFDWEETYVPVPQLEWLATDLEEARDTRVIVFIHQNLHDETDPHGVKNAPEVRHILEEAGTVMTVFQGHMHTGGYAEINGIHYVTLRAGVEGSDLENNAYAMVYVHRSGLIRMEGYKRQKSYELD